MLHPISIAAILPDHIDVSNVIRELQRSGCDLSKISIVGKDSHTDGRSVGYYNTGHRLNYWGTLGAFWGGLWGLLNGSAFFVIPGIGQVLVAGPMVAAIVNGMEEELTTPPLNALNAGLYRSKVPKDRLGIFESAVRSSKYVLCAHGDAFETAAVHEVLKSLGIEVLVMATATNAYAVDPAPRVFVVEVI